ncbi:hypothetical protein NMG60_11007985 [Bertholletia excelsa]
MAIGGEDDGDDIDIEINPVGALLTEDVGAEAEKVEKGKNIAAESETIHELQHHHLHSIESTVVIRQLRSLGLSFQLWPAATTLVVVLDRHRSQPTASPLSPILSALRGESGRRLRILELGAGTGLVGIAAAATLCADVTLTDLPHVLPNLHFNADANSEVVAKNGGSVVVAALSWGSDDDMEAIGREYDLILGSDVVYHDHLYDPLLRTLNFFLLGGEKRILFVMAHLKRWKKESAFFKRARKVFDVDVIHVEDPPSGSRIGVVVFRFAAKLQKSEAMEIGN